MTAPKKIYEVKFRRRINKISEKVNSISIKEFDIVYANNKYVYVKESDDNRLISVSMSEIIPHGGNIVDWDKWSTLYFLDKPDDDMKAYLMKDRDDCKDIFIYNHNYRGPIANQIRVKLIAEDEENVFVRYHRYDMIMKIPIVSDYTYITDEEELYGCLEYDYIPKQNKRAPHKMHTAENNTKYMYYHFIDTNGNYQKNKFVVIYSCADTSTDSVYYMLKVYGSKHLEDIYVILGKIMCRYKFLDSGNYPMPGMYSFDEHITEEKINELKKEGGYVS